MLKTEAPLQKARLQTAPAQPVDSISQDNVVQCVLPACGSIGLGLATKVLSPALPLSSYLELWRQSDWRESR